MIAEIGHIFFLLCGKYTVMAFHSVKAVGEKLGELSTCEVHMTHMVTPGDQAGLRRLGCRYTSDPYYATNALFTGER